MTDKNLKPKLLPKLLAQKEPSLGDFTMIDVGCSGGLDPLFDSFGARLRVYAFDPLLSEIDRLRRHYNNPKFTFEDAYVIYPNYEKLFPASEREAAKENGFFMRTSSAKALKHDFGNYSDTYYNLEGQTHLTNRYISIDNYCEQHGIATIDFLKIDTDGSDYQVLLGAEKLLSKTVMGVKVEANFHGLLHEHANQFHNIDRFLSGHGFTLWDIDISRYSRAELPMPFLHQLPAETRGGAIVWGDAYYFRDLGNMDYETTWNISFEPRQLLALACLFDLLGFPDCAAELMVKRPDAFKPATRNEYLDVLVPPFFPGLNGYDEYVGLFDAHPEFWFPKSGFFGKRS